MSKEEENKAVVHCWVEGLNDHDLDIADEVISDDYVAHISGGLEFKGTQGAKQMLAPLIGAFPDYQYTLDDMVAEGDKVAVRVTLKATHKGDFMGIPPTGKNITTTAAFFYRLADGKITEALQYTDSAAMYQQMGVSPPGQ
jgi:steroid delta-isomerase-like uncharacterized protein